MMESDDSDSDSSSSSCSSSSSSTSCSSMPGPDMMDSDDDIQIQPLTNNVIEKTFTESEIVVDQNGSASDYEDPIYRSPTLSPNTFAPISSC